MATAQINVRIDRALKEAGDAELERLGISPSQIVRALWEKLARGGEESVKVRKALAPEAPTSPEYERKLAVLERYDASLRAFEEMLAEAGADVTSMRPLTREEMYEARYQDYLEMRGCEHGQR